MSVIIDAGMRELQKQISRANDRLDHLQRATPASGSMTVRSTQSRTGLDDTEDESISAVRPREAERDSPLPTRRSRVPDSDDDTFSSHTADGASTRDELATAGLTDDSEDDNNDGDEGDDVPGTGTASASPLQGSRDKKSASGGSLTVRGLMKRPTDLGEARKSIGTGRSVVDTRVTSPFDSPVRSARDVMAEDSSDDMDSIEQIDSINRDEFHSPAPDADGGAPVSLAGVSAMGKHGASPGDSIPCLVDPNEALSSADSSPMRSPSHVPTLAVSAKARNFMESMDNSFDDSADHMSPMAPPRSAGSASPSTGSPRTSQQRHHVGYSHSPEKDRASARRTDDSNDDNELPRYRPHEAAAAMAAEIDEYGDDDDGVAVAHTSLVEDSEDKVKSFSLLSASDDGSNGGRNRTLDSLARSDDSSTESRCEQDSKPPQKQLPQPSPGRLPKSNSSKFSHELEEVVQGYWKEKGPGDTDVYGDAPLPVPVASESDIGNVVTTHSMRGSVASRPHDDEDGSDSDWDGSDSSFSQRLGRGKGGVPALDIGMDVSASEKRAASASVDVAAASEDSDIDGDDELLMSGKAPPAVTAQSTSSISSSTTDPSAAAAAVEEAGRGGKESSAVDPYEGLSMR